MPSAGWRRSRWSLMTASKPCGDSSRMTIWRASRPWLVAFLEERSLPWAVTGPVDRAPLALEARMRASEDIKYPSNYRIERGVKGFGGKCFVCGEKSLKWKIGGRRFIGEMRIQRRDAESAEIGAEKSSEGEKRGEKANGGSHTNIQ